jgi:L-cysteine S-thiosulfotransferase
MEESFMSSTRGIAALLVTFLVAPGAALAQGKTGPGIAIGRQMLAEDNPGELWIEQGKTLFHEKRGPKNASLEQCDFGLGPGTLEGASARLPRYFPDTGRVQDLESRLLTCMVELQGFNRDEVIRRAISPAGSKGSDVEALALYITSRSNGMKISVALVHPKEQEMYKAGEYLFFRRSGQNDFSCMQCHGQADKRIRLQDLVHMTGKNGTQEIAGTWPAYRGAHYVVRTMQWRLYDCFWQMRLPELVYASDASIALLTYLNYQGNGATIQVPGFKR